MKRPIYCSSSDNKLRSRQLVESCDLIWGNLETALENATSLGDVLVLAMNSPAESAPGRRFHMNLLCLLSEKIVPGGAGRDELLQYLKLFMRLDGDAEMIQALEVAALKKGPLPE